MDYLVATNSVVKAGVDGTRNFIDGGYGEKFSQSFANGNYGDATGFLLAGTAFSFMNAITFGEVGAITNTTKIVSSTIIKDAVPEAYIGVKEASKYLKEMGMSRARRVEILQSFEVGTINVRTAGASEYGLRFYDGVKAFDKGRYLFETFPATREALALSSNWNQMTNVIQWQIKSGSVLFEGRAAAQGVGLPGGQIQKFVPSIESLVKVKP